MIRVEDLEVVYPNGTHALAPTNLIFQSGIFTVFLGASGAGKSTLLRALNGLVRPTRGRVLIDGIGTLSGSRNIRTHRRRTGMVFQQHQLIGRASVLANVLTGRLGYHSSFRTLLPFSAHEKRLGLDAIERVGLIDCALRRADQLSGGQQQRVAIARAIVIEPPLVLMDEPLSNLDAKLRLEMRAEIRRIHRELGRSTIYVTHDQDEALSLADRIVVMKDGKVQQIDTPQAVYAQPANLHVARFMGYRNVLELDVEKEEGDLVTLTGPGIRIVGTRKAPLAGRRSSVAIRPEEAALADAGAANSIAGKVANVEYGGHDSLVDVVTAAGTVLHVRSARPPRLGDPAHVQVPVERALVYPVG
jgi:putative spermidine/putrescine transport system ATP-binding protein